MGKLIDFYPPRRLWESAFPQSEYKERWNKAKKLMDEQNIDALIILCAQNLEYFSGWGKPGHLTHWPNCIVFPRDDEPVFLVTPIYITSAEETSQIKNIRPWGPVEHKAYPDRIEPTCLEPLIKTMKDLMLDDKVIGMEHGYGMFIGIPYEDVRTIEKSLPDAKFVNASNLIWKLRVIKSPLELDAAREAISITCKGVRVGFESLEEGMTEKELMRIIRGTMMEEGGTIREGPWILSGPERYKRALFCSPETDRRIRKGDLIFYDGGCYYKGYRADIQRHAIIGEPSEKEKKMFEVNLRQIEEVLENIRPGVKPSELYEVSCNIAKEAGYGDKLFLGRIGHGCGLSLHEPPSIDPYWTAPLESGMRLNIEPDVLDYPNFEVFGAKIEEDIIVTKDGCEICSEELERELWIVR